ncbi:hypothetical protein NFI96_019495 [Prochilodus magdalenae]|nr:hypothetical protein NFI96_019495 [Prochilodus magdalenae]
MKELKKKHERMTNFSKDLQKKTCPFDNTKFYSDSSVQPECIVTALECASKELQTVASECFSGDFNATVQCTTIGRFIQELLNEPKKATDETTAKTCKACETYPQKSHKDFLNDVETLVKKFNTH